MSFEIHSLFSVYCPHNSKYGDVRGLGGFMGTVTSFGID